MIYSRFLTVLLTFVSSQAFSQFDFDILGEIYPEDFFKAPGIGNASLSPSGSKLIYAAYESENQNFYVVDTETLEKTPYFGKSKEKSLINFVAWKDEHRIIFQEEMGNIYLLDLSLNTRTLLFDSERVLVGYNAVVWGNFSLPRVISLLPGNHNAILVSAYDKRGSRQVYIVDLNESEKSDVLFKNPKNFDSFYADSSGKVRMAMKYGTRNIEFFHRQVDSDKWTSFEKAFRGGELEGFDLDKSNITQRRDYFLGFDFDPNRFYFASNRLTNTTAIYLYDMAERRVVEQVAHDPSYDFVDVTELSTHTFLSKKRKRWVGFYCNRDIPKIYWTEPFFEKIQSRVDGKLRETYNYLIDWNDAETIFLVSAVKSNRPVSYHLFDRETDEIKLLGYANESLAGLDTPETQPISYTARDGLKIEGYFTPANRESDRIPPLIMLIHGGPWMRDSYGFDPVVQWLCYKGYSVLQVNYRGSTGYGYNHFYAMKDDFGIGVQNDIEDGLKWALENGYADPERNAIMGMSYGGYATALALTTNPELFKCGVAISGVYDLIEATKTLKKETNRGLSYESWRAMVGKEWRDRDRLRGISPIHHVASLNKPLFLVHGRLDEIVKYEQVQMLRESLDEAGKQYEFMEVEDEGHGFYLPRNQAKVYDAVVNFLDKHLKHIK